LTPILFLEAEIPQNIQQIHKEIKAAGFLK
jgi:hypothetical protein